MQKKDIWKWVILIGVTAWSLSLIYPPNDIKDSTGKVVQPGKITYGLDLKGGTRYVLQVDISQLSSEQASDAAERAGGHPQPRGCHGCLRAGHLHGAGQPSRGRNPRPEAGGPRAGQKNVQSAAFLEFRMVHAKSDELVDEFAGQGLAEGYKIVNVPDRRSGGPWDYKQLYKREGARAGADFSEEQIREQDRMFQVPSGGYELLMQRRSATTRSCSAPCSSASGAS